MEIRLEKATEERMVASIQRYLSESFEVEAGTLQAGLFLRFVLAELGPSIYNQAIADAQAALRERVEDLSGTCFVPEFTHWKAGGGGRSGRR